MAIDSVTALGYGGLFQDYARKLYEAGKVNPDSEEARVQGILEEKRIKVQPIVNVRGKIAEHQKLEKNVKEKRIEFREMGKIVDILV